MWHTEYWTAVSTLLSLISSTYRDLHNGRSNQHRQNAETLPLHNRSISRCQINQSWWNAWPLNLMCLEEGMCSIYIYIYIYICHIYIYYEMFLKTVVMTFFIDCCPRNTFFTGDSLRFHSMDYLFNSGSLWQTLIKSIYKDFFFENIFLRTYHRSPVIFIWFILFLSAVFILRNIV